MLAEELRCLDIADGMAQRGEPLTIERLDAILRQPQAQQDFLKDPYVDPDIRGRFGALLDAAQTQVEPCNEIWRMKWFVMQCRFNPAMADRAKRFWSFTAPPLPEPLPSSVTVGSE